MHVRAFEFARARGAAGAAAMLVLAQCARGGRPRPARRARARVRACTHVRPIEQYIIDNYGLRADPEVLTAALVDFKPSWTQCQWSLFGMFRVRAIAALQ